MIVSCPSCNRSMAVGVESPGQMITCQHCQNHFITPSEVASAPAAAAMAVCSECGTAVATSDLADFGGRKVCASCKPVYVQKLKEGVAAGVSFEYAGFWTRFLAKIIDTMIMGIGGAVIGVAFGSLVALSGGEVAGEVLIQLLSWAMAIAYTTWFVGRFSATPGKMALGLKIVKPDGAPLTYMQAFGRYWGELVSGLTLTIGYIMAAFDDEGRALHDRICATRVIKT